MFLANLKVAWRHNRTELPCVQPKRKNIYIRNNCDSEITLYCGLCYRPISCFNLSVLAASSTSVVGTWRNLSVIVILWLNATAALFTINADGAWSYPYGGGNWWQEEIGDHLFRRYPTCSTWVM